MSDEKEKKEVDELTLMRSMRNQLGKLTPDAAARVVDWLAHWNGNREPGVPLNTKEDSRQVSLLGGL